MPISFLSSLYSYLETEYDASKSMFSYFDKVEPKTEDETMVVNLERCFLTMLPGDFYAKHWNKETKQKAAEYLRERISCTKNPHLLTRYEFHLFQLTKDYKVLFKGVEDGCLQLQILMAGDSYESAHAFCNNFKILYPLAKKVKKADALNQILTTALSNGSRTLQRSILSMVYFSDHDNKGLVNSDARPEKPLHFGKLLPYENLAKLALERSGDDDLKSNQHLLEIAAFYADKTQKKEIKAEANGKLGDYWIEQIKTNNSQNLAIAHLNDMTLRCAMECYKKAGNKTKLDNAVSLYESNKAKIDFPVFSHTITIKERNKQLEDINKIVKDLVDGGPNIILSTLLGFIINIFGKSAEQLRKDAKDNTKKFFYTRMMETSVVDSFGNIRETTHEKIFVFQIIDAVYRNFTYHIFSLVLMNGINRKDLTYEALSKYLMDLGFGLTIDKRLTDGSYVGSTYLERIDTGIKEFLHQNELLMDNKPADWRFCITFLTTQFEGLLRDIVRRLGGTVSKTKHGTDTELVLLEGLLNDDCLKKVFDANDMLLFRETFTNEGYNIRNNVAHGMYLPQEYTASKALLVFISVLRLAKATRFLMS